MKTNQAKKLELGDGSSIAVIGGGPAGSFFTIFVYDLADRMGINLNIDIYEAKSFLKTGPAGCNHCGGIVSESLVQALSAEGIVLPSDVIRRGIDSYTLHMEQGTTLIDTPFREQRIASMFRGAGPLGSNDSTRKSFDGYLLELCKKKGAELIFEKVTEAINFEDGIEIKTKNKAKKYDLVVGAFGLDKRTFELFGKIMPGFRPPKTTKTYISEFHLGKETIDKHFGDSMHVFLLDLPNIKFGALIPKGDFVTLVLLGKSIDKKIAESFIHSESVKSCFPENTELKSINPCQCFPSINIGHAKHPYHNRIVMIGDTSSSKLYKNGIGAAYITAKAAANTAIFEGVSKEDFKKSFLPVCKKLDRDNGIGKMIFLVTTVIQKSSVLKKGLFRMVVNEQKKEKTKRKMSSVLWDTFTGSAPYQGILLRTVNPRVILTLVWNILLASLKNHKNEIK